MADFTLPARPKRRASQAPTLPISALPGRGEGSQAGVEGFLTRLPAGMGAGTPAYQAGLDQSRGGQLAAGLPPAAQDNIASAQAQSLQEHKAYREGLNATQQQVDVRNNDLRLAQNLLIATDPGTDKAVRKFMLQGLSNAVGVDPKGEYSQTLQKMVLGMAPEGLEALRGSFTDDITNSPPGVIKEKLGALFSGAIPVENVIGQVKEHQEAKAAAATALTSPGLPLTSGAPMAGATAEGVIDAPDALEIAGGAGVAAAAAPPSAAQRQAVIQAAGLSDAPTATTPPQEAPAAPTTPPEVAPPPEMEASSPIPVTSSSEPLPETAPVQAPEPPPPPAPQAQPAPPLSDAPTATTPPTASTPPPEVNSKMEIPEGLKEAAEQSGDKLLLDAIDRIERRNAVLDSDAIHRKRQPPPTGTSGSASASSFLPSTQARPVPESVLPPGGIKTPDTGPEPGVEIVEGTPLTMKEGAQALGRAILDALPPDPITGLRPGDAFPGDKATEGIKSTAKNYLDTAAAQGVPLPPEEKKVLQTAAAGADLTDPAIPRGTVREMVTTKSPGEIHQEDMVRNNEFARRNPAPKQPVEFMKPGERPPPDQEVTSAVKALGVTKPGERTIYRDVERYLPNLPAPDDKEGNTKLNAAIVKKNSAAGEVVRSATDIKEVLANPAGAAAVGGVGSLTTGGATQFVEGVKALTGFKKEWGTVLDDAVNLKVNEWKAANAGNLTTEQIAVATAQLKSHLTRFAYAQAAVFNPRGQISETDFTAAARTVGSMNMTSAQFDAVLKDSVGTALQSSRSEVASLTGRNLGHDWEKALPEEDIRRVVSNHAKWSAEGKSIYDPNDIKDMTMALRDMEARREGRPERENKYIVSSGGTRPEDYEAKGREKATLERETAEETLKGKKQHTDLEQQKWEMDQEKWDYKKAQDQKQEARQALLDARHAQEKMAAAFQHIGAMIAGSVKGGAGIGGGSGISAGGEDTSVFRLAPTPQRAAPRVGNAPALTRYGGPIKKQ